MITGYENWEPAQLDSATEYTRNLLLMDLSPEKQELLFNDLGRLSLERFVRGQDGKTPSVSN